MRLGLTIAAVLAALIVVGCQPPVRERWFACTTDATCPSGWHCSAGLCQSAAGPPECRVDLHCDDGNICTLDICEAGRCAHDPEPGPCDDDDFCNGPDACSGGVCANVGPPPCPGACSAFTCADCGALGQACCPGESCSEGLCVGGMCERCGGASEPCCFGFCDGVLACDFMTDRCGACGGDGQVCCEGGVCDAPLSCETRGLCAPDPFCVGVACPGGTVCVGGDCIECGVSIGSPCCPDGGCSVGFCNPGLRQCEKGVTPA